MLHSHDIHDHDVTSPMTLVDHGYWKEWKFVCHGYTLPIKSIFAQVLDMIFGE